MTKSLMTIGLILACQAASIVAIYFGRIKDMAACGSDITLFVIPFVVAVAAYATVLVRMIRFQHFWAKGLLVAMLSLVAGAVAESIGMAIAFNLWGT